MALDIDWSAPPRKCETCDYPTWHVCTVGKPNLFPSLLKTEAGAKRGRRQAEYTDAERANLSDAQLRRWAAYREEMKPVFDAIIDRYSRGDIGIKALAKELEVGRGTVLKALAIGVEEGRCVMRPRGRNVRLDI